MELVRVLLISALVSSWLFANAAIAAVYKYQDESGKWHFTDKPPKNKSTTAVTTSSQSQTSNSDLKQLLQQKFSPASKIEEASLSVVTVITTSGSGSGFFISNDGYMVTNRHVVRPSTSTQSKDQEAALSDRKQELDDFKLDLKDDKERLQERKLTIDEESEYISSNQSTSKQKKQYKRYVGRYKKDKEIHESNIRKYREMKREYEKDKSEFGWKSSMSNFSKKFTIRLKNGKKLSARLVKISKNHDLALLKLDHYTTPYLVLSKQNNLRQGTNVYAIGSPLGITDSLTAGIITKSDPEHIVTDTQILPGNSGGPLIDAEGRVVGVNTAVVSQSKKADGLGLAIYAIHIRQEFATSLPGQI